MAGEDSRDSRGRGEVEMAGIPERKKRKMTLGILERLRKEGFVASPIPSPAGETDDMQEVEYEEGVSSQVPRGKRRRRRRRDSSDI